MSKRRTQIKHDGKEKSQSESTFFSSERAQKYPLKIATTNWSKLSFLNLLKQISGALKEREFRAKPFYPDRRSTGGTELLWQIFV